MTSKTPHPFLKCNAFQKVFHTWVTSLLRLGRKRPLEIDDVFDILPDDQSQPWTDRIEKAWQDDLLFGNKSNKANYRPSLLKATAKAYGRQYVTIGVFLLIYTICRFIQPFILARFIRYFAPCSNVPFRDAVLLATLTSAFPWIMFLSRHMAFIRAFIAGMRLRCAYSGLVFRKIMKLSTRSLGIHSSGKIVNLLTNDVQAIERLALDGHFIWLGLLETIVVLAILWSRVGVTILLAIIYTCFVLLLQMICGKCIQLIWTKRVRQTDLRIKLMNEVVKSIHLVKMYVWERPFRMKVEDVRRRETFYVICQSIANTVKIVNGQAFPNAFFLVIFGLLWYQKATFDTEFFTIAFVLISYLRNTYLNNFSSAFTNLTQYWVAAKRIEDFLLSEEYDRSAAITYDLNSESTENDGCAVDVRQVSSYWETNASFHLQDITFSARYGDLIMVIGSIASGKSSLLMTLLGEMSITHGTIAYHENSHVCYVPQEPWIFSGTIKENILFGLEYDAQKFNRCIHATALHIDLENLPYGDSTIVGDNGVILSGGQKARLSLARALYRDEDIYLLDDPLSAVDVEVGRHIVQKCILGRLSSKVCILVTHQIQFLKYATKIIFLDKGVQIATGTYTELIKTCPEFTLWTETTTQKLRAGSGSTNASSSQLNLTTTPEYLTQFSLVTALPGNEEEEKLLPPLAEKPVQKETVETKRTGSVGISVFTRYIKAGGCGVFGLTCLFIIFATTSAIILISNWWLGRWSNAERIRYSSTNSTSNCSTTNVSAIATMSDNEWFNKRDQYFYILLTLSLSSVVLLFIRTMAYFVSCHITSRSLHNQMFNALLRAPVLFFDSNPIGRVVNRFSKDISSIDEQLSDVTYNFVDVFFNILSTIIFIAYMQPLSLISIACVGVVLERVRRVYTPAVRDMKRLESLSRSPIYSHLSASIQGVLIIRAYRAQQTCVRDFANCLDEHSRVYSVMLGMNRWSAMRIECVVAAFIGFLAFSILLMHRNIPISDLSLILAYSFTLVGSVQWIVRLTVDVMMQMTSVERVIEYVDLKPEEAPNTQSSVTLSPEWPIGGIIFDNLSFRYSSTSSWVLKNINISIQPNEKIGIVGRTGAGKSSIIQSLFRMAELSGRILIDGVDTQLLSLYDLRRHISIIPQDPVLFNDTLRINLDPFGEYSDTEIWTALEEVQLKLDVVGGLQQQITEGGSNLSVGQRQLICLARALLRKNKILVIDEATANVDHKTDELIQTSIRRKFVNCTVLTIAHRLRTIIDSDKILVLSHGQVVEFASPYELLSDEQSQFSQIVSQTGDRETAHLIQQAKKASTVSRHT
ncbi:unnamed protein product [Adineta ricciae]|uniref:Uncharacterized protein n=1 Tax=Adineta ricciae TaxID=249248 RepID=A0A813Y7U9_ADIRI|nr:unnamed protein product [Adineta ricciae]CAF0932653.1 unnamed protein product [Adineta ricciae]